MMLNTTEFLDWGPTVHTKTIHPRWFRGIVLRNGLQADGKTRIPNLTLKKKALYKYFGISDNIKTILRLT